MKKIAIVAVLTLAVTALAGCGLQNSNQRQQTVKEPIKIGVIAPLSGPAAIYGNSFVKGIELARKDIPNTRNSYELIIEDDAGSATVAASAANKLINVNKVRGLLTVTAATGEAIKSLAEENKISHINVSVDTKIASGEYNFTNLLLPDDEAAFWAKEAKKRGIKNIVILNQVNPGINMMVESLIKASAEAGIDVVYQESFNLDTKDMNTLVMKAGQKNSDLFFVASYPPALDIIVQDMKSLGINKPISSFAFFTLSAKPELLEGQWFTDPAISDLNFIQQFKKQFPDTKFNSRTAPYGYDSFMILVSGFEKGQDASVYVRNLINYEGKAGLLIKDGNKFHSTPAIWVIKNGLPEIVK